MKTSKLGKINLHDFLKGLFVSIITAFVAGLGQSLTTGKIPSNIEDFKPIGLAAASAGIAYVGKNLMTNSEDKILVKEPIEKIE